MRKYFFILALATTTLAGCMQTPGERAAVGGLVGLAAADAMDENMVAGGLLGAAAGAGTCMLPGARCKTY